MDMRAAYTKGFGKTLPQAAISFDRFHVVALANEAMDAVRREEMCTQPVAVREALGSTDRKVLKGLMWGMLKSPLDWSLRQTEAMLVAAFEPEECERMAAEAGAAWGVRQSGGSQQRRTSQRCVLGYRGRGVAD